MPGHFVRAAAPETSSAPTGRRKTPAPCRRPAACAGRRGGPGPPRPCRRGTAPVNSRAPRLNSAGALRGMRCSGRFAGSARRSGPSPTPALAQPSDTPSRCQTADDGRWRKRCCGCPTGSDRRTTTCPSRASASATAMKSASVTGRGQIRAQPVWQATARSRPAASLSPSPTSAPRG